MDTSPETAEWIEGQDDIRVITNDGERIRLGAPILVEGDSLRGEDERPRASSSRRAERVSIALSDISALQRSRTDGAATAGVAVVGGLAAAAVVRLGCCAPITW